MNTIELSKELGINHKSIYRLFLVYQKDLEDFGSIEKKEDILNKTGRPCKYFELSNKQKLFLTLLTRNNKKTVAVKKEIFIKYLNGG